MSSPTQQQQQAVRDVQHNKLPANDPNWSHRQKQDYDTAYKQEKQKRS